MRETHLITVKLFNLILILILASLCFLRSTMPDERNTPDKIFGKQFFGSNESLSEKKCEFDGNLREHKRVEHGEEEVDCQEVKEDSWLHCHQGSNISKTQKHIGFVILSEKRFSI